LPVRTHRGCTQKPPELLDEALNDCPSFIIKSVRGAALR
jgi:hypothetical protein